MNIDVLYNYYLWNIHYMINTLGFKWCFDNINNYNSIRPIEDILNSFWSDYNPFLRDYREEHLLLAKDILENGMYFPFFSAPYIDGGYGIIMGTHRFYSLLRYINEVDIIDNEYLFIVYPKEIKSMKEAYELKDYDYKNIKLYNYCFGSNSVQKREIFCIEDCIINMDVFGSEMSLLIHKLRNQLKIYPNSILSNKNLFYDFITNPYSIDNDISSINENYFIV